MVHSFRGLLCALACVLGLFVSRSAADEPPVVVLPPLRVSLEMLNIPVQILYQENFFSPSVVRVTIGRLKHNSIATRAGLKSGLEIISIQGHPLENISKAELDQLLSLQVPTPEITLVCRNWWGKQATYHIPIPHDAS